MTTATEIRPQAGPQEAFLSSPADIVIYGGAAGGGKTWGILLEPLRYISNPDFGGVIFRKTFPQIRNEGGLWDASEKLYPMLGAEPFSTRLEWRFRSGASVRFAHMDHEKDKLNYQGAEIPFIGFDELTHFTQSQFFYMLSRNRSMCGVRPYVRATCNPDADSWVADFIEWWIDQSTGFPIAERSGIIRWFARDGGVVIWGDTPDEVRERVPHSEPKSFTFIPSKLEDNPALMAADPGYRGNLLALPVTDRKRLLDGNWKVRSMEGAEWEDHPEYFESHIWCDGDEWPDAFEASIVMLDASKGSKKKSADYSAVEFIGFAQGKVWVDATIKRQSATDNVATMFDLWYKYSPLCLGVESNGFQDLYATIFDYECHRRGVPPIPVKLIHNHAKKEARIKAAIEPYLQKRMIRILRSPGGQMLLSQLRGFGIADHDDGPDALEMGIRLLREIVTYDHSGGRYSEVAI